MTKEELVKKSIENNIIDSDAVLQNVISAKIDKSNRPKMVAVCCLCFIIVGLLATSPLLLTDNNYDISEQQESEDISVNNESKSEISVSSEITTETDEILNQYSLILNQSSLDHNLPKILLTDDNIINDEEVALENNSDIQSVAVYENKHDGIKFNSYFYKTYPSITRIQAYNKVLDGKYLKELPSGMLVPAYRVSKIVYISGDECDYYLPFYIVLVDESAYFVSAVAESN